MALPETLASTRVLLARWAARRLLEAQLNAWPTPDGRRRMRCLRCPQTFSSAGKANRLCAQCRALANAMGEAPGAVSVEGPEEPD